MLSRITPVLAGLLICAAPVPVRADPVGLYCADGGDSFLIGRSTGDGTLAIRISSWQGMHHCGIDGTARAVLDGWLLETSGCRLRLHEEGGAIVLAASPDEACAPFCGARARLDGLRFAEADRVSTQADPALFARDLGELGPC